MEGANREGGQKEQELGEDGIVGKKAQRLEESRKGGKRR